MSRGLSGSQITAAAAPHRQAVPLIEALFDSGALRLAIAPWDVYAAPFTYTAVGPILQIREVRESAASLEGMEFVMTGLDPAIITIATSEPYRGRIIRLMKAPMDPATNQLLGVPVQWWIGRIQNMVIQEDNGSATVTVVAEHYEAELDRPAPLRYSDADQQRRFFGDFGCQYAAQMTEKTVVFPSKEAQRR